MSHDVVATFLLTFAPAYILLLIQIGVGIDWAAEKVSLPEIGMDCSISAVALAASVSLLSTVPVPAFPDSEVLVAHVVILIFVMAIMTMCARISAHPKRRALSSILGLFSLVFSSIWSAALILYLSGY